MSFALFFLERYEEGMTIAQKSIQTTPDVISLASLIVNAVSAGRTAEAQAAVARLLVFQPNFRAPHAEHAFPTRLLQLREKIASSLRAAGVPN